MTRTAINYWIDAVSLLVMVGLAATGGVIHFVLPAGSGHFATLFGWNRHEFGDLHFYLAVAAVALLAVHVLLHWTWICCVTAKMAGRSAPSQTAQTLWGLALLLAVTLFLGGGLYWATTAVQQTEDGRGGHGRGRHRELTQQSRVLSGKNHHCHCPGNRVGLLVPQHSGLTRRTCPTIG